MKKIIILSSIEKNKGGFTLLELVMTIVLTGIMAVGLYSAVMFGVKGYLQNEQYLDSSNSMSYAATVIRRNLENAAMPTADITPSGSVYCTVSPSINPYTLLASGYPIVVANLSGQTTTCGGANPPCDEAAFYKYINGTSNQELVVFCVNNQILYKEVTDTNGTTTSYPVIENISNINF